MTSTSSYLKNEKELFLKISIGDTRAFSIIYYHYLKKIHPFLIKLIRSENDTEDIIQDIFKTIWESRRNLSNVHNYKAYVFTITTNKAYTFLKERARKHLELIPIREDLLLDSGIVLEEIDLKELNQALGVAIDSLSEQKRTIFNLSRKIGLSHQEIADKLDISKSTVNNHLTEAIRSVKDYLKSKNYNV